MNLNELFKNAPNIEIEQLSIDSRLSMKNAIFFCLDGIKYDGHKYVNEAICNGAIVVVYSKDSIDTSRKAIYIKVNNVNDSLLRISNIFYNNPNDSLNEYLVSGCYGRSTVSSIIKNYLDQKTSCASVGVFGINYLNNHFDTNFPALTALDNVKLLDNLKKNNVKNVVFETSSISLFYKKFDVIKPNVFIYTNTSKHCSDYKVCNNNYFEYIRRYLYTLEDSTTVLLNKDDTESFIEFRDCINNYKTYGFDRTSDYYIHDIEIFNRGSSFKLTVNSVDYSFETKLLNISNIYNLTAAIAALNINGYDIYDICSFVSKFNYVEGVMEHIDDKYNIIIDCGSELDNIETNLKYANQTSKGKLICVISINYSDRSEHIKSLMKLLQDYSDIIILTEDESSEGEIMQILSRADEFTTSNDVIHIPFRSLAIENAINIMKENDTLLILGKGNENYIVTGLGKDRYLGDKFYANKYLKIRKDLLIETI